MTVAVSASPVSAVVVDDVLGAVVLGGTGVSVVEWGGRDVEGEEVGAGGTVITAADLGGVEHAALIAMTRVQAKTALWNRPDLRAAKSVCTSESLIGDRF